MDNSFKVKVKKVLLFLTLLPYIVFLIMGIFNGCQAIIEKGYLDLFAFIEPLNDFWFDILTDVNVFLIVLTIFCVGYPIYYFWDNKKKDNGLKPLIKVKKIDKLFVLYMISFLPYLSLVYFSIFGIEFGFFFNTDIYYGFQAILLVLIMGSVIPIYPILLIFQIIYTIGKYKAFSNVQKKILKSCIVILLILLLVPSTIHFINSKHALNEIYNQDKIVIEEYLKKEFGEENYNSMRILKLDDISSIYKIKTPFLNYYFELSLNETRTEVVTNSFYKDFVKENDLNFKLNDYLKQYYNFPEYLDVNSSISSFDAKDINDIDKLITNCSYKINSYYISQNNYKKEEIIEIIKDYYIKYNQDLKQYYNTSYLIFVVNVNDEKYASIQTMEKTNEEGMVHLIFSGYNYGNGLTIESDELTLNIYETSKAN